MEYSVIGLVVAQAFQMNLISYKNTKIQKRANLIKLILQKQKLCAIIRYCQGQK